MSSEQEQPLTPEDAQTEIAQVMFDQDDLYHAQHAGRIGHDERVTELTRLFATAYPEGGESKGQEAPPQGEEPSAGQRGADETVELPALPDGYEWDQSGLKEFEQTVNDLGVSATTTRRILELDAECCRQEPPPAEETLALLREEWGAEFERKLYAAKKFVQENATASQLAYLEESGLGDHPEMVRLMAAEGERRLAMLGEDPQLLAEIARHPRGSPGHEAAVAKRDALFRRVYGTRRAA